MEHKFGGPWTIIKLEVLEKYLAAYTTALKNMSFDLIYIDAFAGNGYCDTRCGTVEGSARIALKFNFNKYIFIEKDFDRKQELENFKKEFPSKKIEILDGDCNVLVDNILDEYNWSKTRAIAFLDPYNMSLKYTTLKKIASKRSFDIWYLFPFNNVTRSLRKNNDIPEKSIFELNEILGTTKWRENLYYKNPQISFFDNELEDNNFIRKEQKNICCFFKKKMNEDFPYVSCPICLKNKNNAPLFLLYFAISNPSKNAINLANKIATSIISKQGTYVCSSHKNNV